MGGEMNEEESEMSVRWMCVCVDGLIEMEVQLGVYGGGGLQRYRGARLGRLGGC